MAQATKGALRSMKNVAKGYSELQIKVREATSNDPWGPSTELMHQIATQSHSNFEFSEIMTILSKRLNDHGRNWRHVHKALILLDYLIHCGSAQIVEYAKEKLYIVKTLREFQYVSDGVDYGANVRQKAKELTELLADDERIQQQRKDRSLVTNRIMSDRHPNSDDSYRSYPLGSRRPSASSDLDQYEEDVRRAIRESLKTSEEEEKRKMKKSTYSVPNLSEEEQLKKAIELSKKEEEERQMRMYGTRVGMNSGSPYASSSSASSSSSHKKNTNDLIDLLTGEEQPLQPTPSQSQSAMFDPFGVAAPIHHPFHVPMENSSQTFAVPPSSSQPYPLLPSTSSTFPSSHNQQHLPPSQTLAFPSNSSLLALPSSQPIPSLPSSYSSTFPQTNSNDFNPFVKMDHSSFVSNNHAPSSLPPSYAPIPSQPLLSFSNTNPSHPHSVVPLNPPHPPHSSTSLPAPMVNLDQLTAKNPFASQPNSAPFQWHQRPPSTSGLSLNQLAQQPPPLVSSSSSQSNLVSTNSFLLMNPANNAMHPSIGQPTSSSYTTSTSTTANLTTSSNVSQPSQAQTNPFLL